MPNFKRVPKKTLTVIADLIEQMSLFDVNQRTAINKALKAYPQVWAHLSQLMIDALVESGINPPASKTNNSADTDQS